MEENNFSYEQYTEKQDSRYEFMRLRRRKRGITSLALSLLGLFLGMGGTLFGIILAGMGLGLSFSVYSDGKKRDLVSYCCIIVGFAAVIVNVAMIATVVVTILNDSGLMDEIKNAANGGV